MPTLSANLAPIPNADPKHAPQSGVSAFGSVADAPAVAYDHETMADWQPDGSKPAYPTSTHGIPLEIRRARYPELHQLRYGVEMVRAWRAARSVEASVDHHVKDYLVEHGDAPEKFLVAWHPWLKRLALFELVRNPKVGPAYHMITVFQTEPMPGMLPADLDAWHHRHLTGRIGQVRIPGAKDFENIRKVSRREKLEDIEACLDADQQAAEKQEAYENEQAIEEFHDYIFNAMHDMENGAEVRYNQHTGKFQVIGAKQRSFPDEHLLYQPRRNPERWAQRTLVGEKGARFKVVARRGSHRDLEYQAEAHQKIDAELAAKEQAAKKDDLLRRARATVGMGLGARRRTM